MISAEGERPVAQNPARVLVGQTLRHELLTFVDFGDDPATQSGWYTSWKDFRDFSFANVELVKARGAPTIREYAAWAYSLLANDIHYQKPAEVGLRSIIVETDRRKYPQSFGIELGQEILFDPDSLLAAREAGSLSLLKRYGLPRDHGAREVFSRYTSALRA